MRKRSWAAALGCSGLTVGLLVGLVLVGIVALIPVGIRGSAAWREQADRTTVAPPGRFVRADDVEIFALERGPVEGPAVVFIHGSGAWSGTWNPTLAALADRGARAVAIDLPPFGFSSRPDNRDYSRRAQARRILAAVDALGIDRFTLVGHSFGGGPTVEAALLAPERLDGLVLVSAALSVGAEPMSLGPLAWQPVRELAVAASLTNPQVTPHGLEHFVHDPAVVTDDWVARYRRPLGVRGTTGAVASWLPELLAPAPSASLQPAAYRDLHVRTLLIWGAEDEATPVSQAEALASWLPDAKLEVLPGVGHLPQIEASDRLHALLGHWVWP